MANLGIEILMFREGELFSAFTMSRTKDIVLQITLHTMLDSAG